MEGKDKNKDARPFSDIRSAGSPLSLRKTVHIARNVKDGFSRNIEGIKNFKSDLTNKSTEIKVKRRKYYTDFTIPTEENYSQKNKT